MPGNEKLPTDDPKVSARQGADEFAKAIPAERRKRLGQFFSGAKLGKILAHLALDPSTKSIFDPMSGSGDLLDAAIEAAGESEIELSAADGIEIDHETAQVCADRIAQLLAGQIHISHEIIAHDSFDPKWLEGRASKKYDLVITNPPFVRYQSRNSNGGKSDSVRDGLKAIVDKLPKDGSTDLWCSLIGGYSGLSDLSVPSLMLAAMMTREGGRLALVLPATWRSRDYADVVQYLLLRFFKLEFVVEDTQPGWFSDAQVRTHLIVAQRLDADDAVIPLSSRTEWSEYEWLRIAPEVADSHSLVGAAFRSQYPEMSFAAWARSNADSEVEGIHSRSVSISEEWIALRHKAKSRRWFRSVEPQFYDVQSVSVPSAAIASIPVDIRTLIGDRLNSLNLISLSDAGIHIGQGLRTGCNKFFYVTEGKKLHDGFVEVIASQLFGEMRVAVPASCLRTVVRRQSDVAAMRAGSAPSGRVLDLRNWHLPEDSQIVDASKDAYENTKTARPQVMPDELAEFVRNAATTRVGSSSTDRLIPELSAVRTNVRIPKNSTTTPRFWYMLPDFTQRHMPQAFLPRVIHSLVFVDLNLEPAILVDANFSTFWASDEDWSGHAIKALLSSSWCRAMMESVGTKMGGGALKLEATHLRHIPVPRLSVQALASLDGVGRDFDSGDADTQDSIDKIVMEEVLGATQRGGKVSTTTERIRRSISTLISDRQRMAS